MAGELENWILMATARAPTNIAVIKYWGKRDENLILPINDSISVTLDPDHLSATTTVAVSPSFEKDRMWLNRKEIALSGGRYQNCVKELRSRAGEFVDENRGIRIGKDDWKKLHVHIVSYNNFPTAAGLASSAAGFACLVFSLAKLMNVKEELDQLSAIARQGSGSACRSLYGGFVKWTMGNETNGSDSIAVQLANETHWDDLVIIVAVVSSKQKETSSTSGMRESVETSSLIHHRAKAVVPSRILQMEEAIRNKDFSSFVQLTCADSNQFHAVCLDTSPPIFYMNDTSHRIISILERWNRHEDTPQVAYTFDAGPNAVMITPNQKVATHLLQRLLFYFPPAPDNELSRLSLRELVILVSGHFLRPYLSVSPPVVPLVSSSPPLASRSSPLLHQQSSFRSCCVHPSSHPSMRYILGDTKILQQAGLHSLDSIERLQPPPEAKDKALSQRHAGDVRYFICTRPGKGPVILGEDQALIHPRTGLPK